MTNHKPSAPDKNITSQETQPWWLSLPKRFNQQLHATEIDIEHKLKVKGSAAVDTLLRTGLASSVLGSMTPHLLSTDSVERDIRHLQFYGQFVESHDRQAVFPQPRRGLSVTHEPVAPASYLPPNAHVELLRVNSGYQTLNPALRETFARTHQGIPAVAQHWRHPDGPRPTLIFTHGFIANAFRFNSTMFSLSWFFKQGYDILLNTLPYHGHRRRNVDVFSGMGLFSGGFAHMNEAFLQGVYDLRVWMDYLEEQGVPAMGAAGYSLGGYATSLAASADERLKFAIPNAPAVLLIDMIMGWAPLGKVIRRMMKSNDLSLADLRYMTAVHCPLSWSPVISPDRLMVIGGAGDRFTSPQMVNALHNHWPGSHMEWFPGNHLMHFQQPSYLRLMKQFMDKACAT